MTWSETKMSDRERRAWSTCYAHFWLILEGDIGCLLALEGLYKPLTGCFHKPCEITVAPHLLRAGHFIHSQKHTVELVKYSRKRVR